MVFCKWCGCAGLGVRGSKREESEQGFAERSRDTLGTSSGQGRSEQPSQRIRVHRDRPTLASPMARSGLGIRIR